MATLNYNNRLDGYKGNSKELTVFTYDASANIMDITDYDGFFYMKKYPVVEGSPLDVSVGHTSKDASNGAFYFILSESDLDIDIGDYVYEVVMDDSSSNRKTLVQDLFSIKNSLV